MPIRPPTCTRKPETAKPPRKRTFGKRTYPPKRPSAEEQQRKVAAYLNFLDIATGKK